MGDLGVTNRISGPDRPIKKRPIAYAMNRALRKLSCLQLHLTVELLVDHVVSGSFLGLDIDVQVDDLGQLPAGFLPILLHVRLEGAQIEVTTVELQGDLLVDLSHDDFLLFKINASCLMHDTGNNITKPM